jgi:hypothetical protein
MRTLLEKYHIRYFPKIANELPSSPIERIIICGIQLLDMFLVEVVKDGDKLEPLLKRKQREKEEAMYMKDTQRLVRD